MDARHYILDGKVTVPVDDVIEWAQQFKRDSVHVGDSTVNGVRVSTVFLGLNHEYDPRKPPLLFETMIFGGEHDQACWRYGTWDEAEVGHERIVADLQAGRVPDDEYQP